MIDQAVSTTRGTRDGWTARCCKVAEYLAVLMLAMATAFVVLQVAARNFMDIGLPWADELARYCGLGIVYLTLPRLLLENGHVAVGMLRDHLTGLSRRVAQLLIETFNLLFCGLFLWAGYAFLLRAGKFTTPALSMPNTLFYLPAAVGMVLLTAVAVIRVWRVLAAWTGGEVEQINAYPAEEGAR